MHSFALGQEGSLMSCGCPVQDQRGASPLWTACQMTSCTSYSTLRNCTPPQVRMKPSRLCLPFLDWNQESLHSQQRVIHEHDKHPCRHKGPLPAVRSLQEVATHAGQASVLAGDPCACIPVFQQMRTPPSNARHTFCPSWSLCSCPAGM